MELIRVDPEKRMNRRYAVFVLHTLFGEPAVFCLWGSRQNAYQRHRLIVCPSLEAAQALASAILRRKRRRGYLPAHRPEDRLGQLPKPLPVPQDQ